MPTCDIEAKRIGFTFDARAVVVIAMMMTTVFGGIGCDVGGEGDAGVDSGIPLGDVFDAVVLDAPPTDDLVRLPLSEPNLGDGQEWIAVGAMAVRGGRSDPIHVFVPEGMHSLTVHMRGHDNAVLLLDEVLGPDGSRLVSPSVALNDSQRAFASARGFPSQFFSPSRQVARVRDATSRIPLRDDVVLSPGVWSIRVRSANADVGGTIALNRPISIGLLGDFGSPDRIPAREELKLAVHHLVAPTPADDVRFAAAFDEVAAIFAPVGIDVVVTDEIVLTDAPQGAVVLDASQGCSGGDVDAILRLSAAPPGTLAVFFIDRFSCVNSAGIDVGAFLGGLTGGIPAPVFVDGSARGGVAIALAENFSDAAFGELLAHEIGHGLGLFHAMETTSPPDPPVFDLISDTLEDEGALQSNLMFPRLNGRVRLSDGQGTVMRRHPGVTP